MENRQEEHRNHAAEDGGLAPDGMRIECQNQGGQHENQRCHVGVDLIGIQEEKRRSSRNSADDPGDEGIEPGHPQEHVGKEDG